jgi:hypothetical protein
MIPLFFVYFFEYAINSGISPTIVFDGWSSDKAYKYYALMYQIGNNELVVNIFILFFDFHLICPFC